MRIHIIEPLAVTEEEMDNFKKVFMELGHEVIAYNDRNENADEIIRRCSGADIVVLANLPFPEKVIKELPQLKMLAVAFTGTDHVAMDACRRQRITVSNASGYSTVNVAELTIGLIIDLLRNVTRLDPVTRSGGTRAGFAGYDLAGKTVGIIGTGEIGLRVAKLLSCFDTDVIGYSRTKRSEARKYLNYADIDTLLERSDIITLHVPLSPETRGFIDAQKLDRMKKGSFLVNCARGPIVNTKDLAAALQNGPLAGAALDVFDTEPPLQKDNPLFSLENVIFTPHIAYATHEAFSRRLRIVEQNITGFLEGKPVNVV